MLYREAGKTGVKLAILGFGCMRLPTRGGKPHLIDEEKAQAMVDYAIRHGVNYFDTAYVYHSEVPFQAGMSEVFMGKALARHRQKVNLATKLPCWAAKSRSDMDRLLDLQLQRLQTDHIDFYLLHCLTADTWKNMSSLGAADFLEEAIADGRIRHAGFSFHDDAPVFKRIVDACDWSFCQIMYSFMDEDFQAGREGLEYAAAKGLAVMLMEPLRGGNLAGKVPESVQAVWDRAETKRTPAEWALRFVWNRPETCVALSGMTEMAHVVENVRIADQGLPNSLTQRELALIQEVKGLYRARTRVNCTSCGYCMPCPSGVNIPGNFQQLNHVFMYGDRVTPRLLYHHFYKAPERASNCEECGQCEDACPQHIPIREMLKEVAAEFETPVAGS
jgi:predicted aldo/keto reductase-like oxidoreductase